MERSLVRQRQLEGQIQQLETELRRCRATEQLIQNKLRSLRRQLLYEAGLGTMADLLAAQYFEGETE